jgi:cytoskeleton protein RodZ
MDGFGAKLRREREMRGITLAEISESTKISRRCLQALEDEQFDLLPGGVFNRGFVRAYARFLGLNEEQAVADYVAASNEQQPPDDKFPLDITQKKSESPALNPRRSLVPVLLALVALVLVVSGWTVWVKRKPQGGVNAVNKSSKAPVQARPVTGDSATASRPSAAASSAPSAAGATTESSETAPDTGAEENSSGPQPIAAELRHGPVADQSTLKPSSRESKQSGPFSVVIKAREDSWISITADGQTLWEGTLNASNERSIQVGKELVLKTGNAAGIDVSYNGKPLGALGKENEVRILTFNTGGLQQ